MLFASAASNNNNNEDGEADPSAYTPDFGPVATNLPPEVEVKTGEEGNEVCHAISCWSFFSAILRVGLEQKRCEMSVHFKKSCVYPLLSETFPTML